jgi:D-glycero-D-manno-heptose 1,7-bisphosphate phosphatase
LRSAIFLDRDGVINRERHDYVRSWSQFAFLPGALPALAALNRAGATVVVVTNQSVVGRGLISEGQLAGIHDRMRDQVCAAGGRIDAIYACVHAPDAGCECRKPRAALLTRAASELGIDLGESVMVGDTLTDVQAARAAGCWPILIRRTRDGLPGDVTVAADLAQAVERALSLRVGVPSPC